MSRCLLTLPVILVTHLQKASPACQVHRDPAPQRCCLQRSQPLPHITGPPPLYLSPCLLQKASGIELIPGSLQGLPISLAGYLLSILALRVLSPFLSSRPHMTTWDLSKTRSKWVLPLQDPARTPGGHSGWPRAACIPPAFLTLTERCIRVWICWQHSKICRFPLNPDFSLLL